ncbi:hypothetical protein M3Y96_01128000 [Aphelenchoides besseyi]|nr:hypothetical protein M3Y96_01128000 [Aphelenchoides besseyi]
MATLQTKLGLFVLAIWLPICLGCARTNGGGGGTIITTTPLITTTTVAPCNAPNTNSVGLTIDTGTTLQDAGVNEPPIAQCTSCQSGTRQFYTSTTATVPSDAIGNMQVAEGVQCPTPANFCTCNSAGVCCTPSGAVDTVLFIPFCSGGTCVMDTVVQGDSGASLVCEDRTTFTVDGTNSDAPLGTPTYFDASSVSCRGCTNIRSDTCTGPTMDDNFDEEDLLFDSSESEPDGGSNMESDDEVVPTKKRKHDEESKDDEMVNFSWFKKDFDVFNWQTEKPFVDRPRFKKSDLLMLKQEHKHRRPLVLLATISNIRSSDKQTEAILVDKLVNVPQASLDEITFIVNEQNRVKNKARLTSWFKNNTEVWKHQKKNYFHRIDNSELIRDPSKPEEEFQLLSFEQFRQVVESTNEDSFSVALLSLHVANAKTVTKFEALNQRQKKYFYTGGQKFSPPTFLGDY